MGAMIFGSEKFEPLVGELKLTTQINESQNQEGQHHEPKELTKFRQRKRVLQCAINLAKKLDEFILTINAVDGAVGPVPVQATSSGGLSKDQEESWRLKCNEEAQELASSAFGGTLVGIIGEVYTEQARAKLDTFDGLGIQTKTFGRRMSTSMSVAGSGLRAAYAASEVNKLQKMASIEGQDDTGAAAAATNENSTSSSSSSSSSSFSSSSSSSTRKDKGADEKEKV